MKICAQCFEDEEIRKFISASSSITATCDCCSLENVKVVDLNELSDFFIELLHLFVKDNTGNDLIPIIQNDWRIFQKESKYAVNAKPERCALFCFHNTYPQNAFY